MTPKTKRRLKWVVTTVSTKDDSYAVYKSLYHKGKWVAVIPNDLNEIVGTKRQAMAACEKHARENPSKK